jgi:hypothetical protein
MISFLYFSRYYIIRYGVLINFLGDDFMKKILSVLILILLTIVSCGGKHATQKDFENTMASLQKGNVSSLVGNDKETAEALMLFTDGYKKITYKINKVTTNNNESILNVTMKSPALTGVMEEIQKKSMQNLDKLMGKSGKELEEESKKIFSEVISQKLNSPNLKYNEETFDVIYTKKGNTWEISPEKNEKLLKALTLGIQM